MRYKKVDRPRNSYCEHKQHFGLQKQNRIQDAYEKYSQIKEQIKNSIEPTNTKLALLDELSQDYNKYIKQIQSTPESELLSGLPLQHKGDITELFLNATQHYSNQDCISCFFEVEVKEAKKCSPKVLIETIEEGKSLSVTECSPGAINPVGTDKLLQQYSYVVNTTPSTSAVILVAPLKAYISVIVRHRNLPQWLPAKGFEPYTLEVCKEIK